MKKSFYPLMTLLCAGLMGCSQVSKPLSSGINLADLDTTAVPGDNFYQYASGGWVKNNPLKPEYARYGSFDAVRENNVERIKELVLELSQQQHAAGSEAQKIGDLYNMVMDSVRLNKEGYAPIQADLDAIAKVKTSADVLRLMTIMGKQGVGGYFYYYISSDMMNSDMNLCQFYQGGTTLPEKDYYLSEEPIMKDIRAKYREHIVNMFKLTGFTEKEAQAKMEAVLEIETRLAKASKSSTELRNPKANYHKLTIAQLKEEFPKIDWNTFFTLYGTPDVKEVSVGQMEAMKEVEAVFSTVPVEQQKAYMQWSLITSAANKLSDAFVTENFNFFSKTLSGVTQQKPRWKRAVAYVNGLLGEAMGKLYVEKYFPAPAKQRMVNLVKTLQESLGERIQKQEWMSDKTKKNAMEKLSTFHVKVGYPDKWMDYSRLDINTKQSLWANCKAASEFGTQYMIDKKYGKPVDRDEWQMNPQTVNAYYNPTTNEICFPAAILQPPFFDMNADDAFNYGAIGVVIGHEMTHGFDDQGRQFDKDGNFKVWWTEEDASRFDKRTQVMVDFFDKLEVLPGLMANGRLTLGENIADHGGLQVSYNAFCKNLKKHPLKTVDGFTAKQRFFLAYAHLWANNIREAEIRQRTKTDPHSLGIWRVNGALPHVDAWYEAFNVTEDNEMFIPKKDRLDIW
jgi:putative endopeptidase